MEQIQLSDDEQRVFEALSSLEGREGAVREDDIAREAGLDPAVTRQVLSALVRDKDLVRVLSPEDRDLGARYRVKDSAS